MEYYNHSFHQQHVISSLLDDLGYSLMASHARKETNNEILKGYAKIIQYAAFKRSEGDILIKLDKSGILN
jgi:hypothetical protein